MTTINGNITEHEGVRYLSAVSVPEAIKVRTIKKKFVDQMRTIEAGKDIPETAEVMGKTRHHIILLIDDRELVKIMDHVYVAWMIGGVQHNADEDRIKIAHDTIRKFVQLFED